MRTQTHELHICPCPNHMLPEPPPRSVPKREQRVSINALVIYTQRCVNAAFGTSQFNFVFVFKICAADLPKLLGLLPGTCFTVHTSGRRLSLRAEHFLFSPHWLQKERGRCPVRTLAQTLL